MNIDRDEDGVILHFPKFGLDFRSVPTGRGRQFRINAWDRETYENFLTGAVVNVENLRELETLSRALEHAAPMHLEIDWIRAIYKAVGAVLSENAVELPWHTAAELAETVSPTPDYLIGPFVIREAVTEMGAKVKVGKTTLVAAMCAAKLNGTPFLGFPVEPGPICYMTEERAPSILNALSRFGIRNHPNLHILLRHEVQGQWADVVELVRDRALAVKAHVLIADTLSDWAGIKDDEENSTGAALVAMRPLQLAASDGLGVMAVRHDRKSGGDIGDSARGASAFSGAADILLSLRRADAQGHENRRVLHAVGRFDGIPPQTVIELQNGQYVALGDAVDVEQREVRATLLETLPRTEERAVTIDQLTEAVGQQRRATLNRVLEALRESGQVLRKKGFGESKRAYGYWLAPDEFFSKEDDPEKFDTDYVPESDVPEQFFRGTSREKNELFTPHSLDENNNEGSAPCPGGCGNFLFPDEACPDCVAVAR